MNRYRSFVNLALFVIIAVIVSNTTYNPFNNQDMQTLKDPILETTKMSDSLYKEIQTKSTDYYKAPEDAYIDNIWKKTPGRNGLEVDVQASFTEMKKAGIFNEKKLVFEEIAPNVSLESLPAAPIYRGHPDKNMVAFLINVSWGTEHIPKILQVLKENQVKATFFIEGKWAKENVEYVKMIAEENHLIGNHAYNHPDMARISEQAMHDQINQTNEIIEAITGETPVWFAPPSGSFNNRVVEIADELKMETILWTVDTIDWKNPSVSVMINRVTGKIHHGATVLMHPTAPVANGLEQMIEEIKRKGYKFGTIEKLLSETR